MKLLYLNHNVAWSGTFFRVFQLARTLVQRGHDVSVVTTSRDARLHLRRELRDGVQLLQAPDLAWGRGRTGWDPWNAWNRARELRHDSFDAIHAFDCRPAVILPALYLARKRGLPLFLDWADWWGRGGTIDERPGRVVNRLIGGVETWFEEAFRHHAVGTTVISRALEQRAEALGVRADSMLRFPNGCDGERIEPRERRAARRALGLGDHEQIVLHVGLVYPGDFRLLFDAFRMVLHARPRARLVLLGNPGPHALAQALPNGALLRTGFVPFETLLTWLGAADLCVIPLRDSVSNRGRWPGKVNDYFCAARAVVMPAVGDAADWVNNAGAGWTCAADREALAGTLSAALRSVAAADEAGAAGRRLAEGTLAWSALAARVEEFYEQVLQRAPLLLEPALTRA